MDTPEKLATLGIQDATQRQTNQRAQHKRSNAEHTKTSTKGETATVCPWLL